MPASRNYMPTGPGGRRPTGSMWSVNQSFNYPVMGVQGASGAPGYWGATGMPGMQQPQASPFAGAIQGIRQRTGAASGVGGLGAFGPGAPFVGNMIDAYGRIGAAGIGSANQARGQIGAAQAGAAGQIGAAQAGAQGQMGAARFGMLGNIGAAEAAARGQMGVADITGQAQRDVAGIRGQAQRDVAGTQAGAQLGSARYGMLGNIGAARQAALGQMGTAGIQGQTQLGVTGMQQATQRQALADRMARFNQSRSDIRPLLQGIGARLGAPSPMAGAQQPQIDAGPVFRPGDTQAMVRNAQGQLGAGAADSNLQLANQFGGRGFAGGGAIGNQMALTNALARNKMADIGVQLPTQHAQINAPHMLAAQQAQEQQFARRQQEDIARQNVLASIFNPMLGLYGQYA